MPGYDGTGPRGSGKQGRGLGICGKTAESKLLKVVSIGIPLLISIILSYKKSQILRQTNNRQITDSPFIELSANSTNVIETNQPIKIDIGWFRNLFKKKLGS